MEKKEKKSVCTTMDVADILAEFIKWKCLYWDWGEYIIDLWIDSNLYFSWEKVKIEQEWAVRWECYEYHLYIGMNDWPRWDLLNPNVCKIKEILLNYMGVYEEDIKEIKID